MSFQTHMGDMKPWFGTKYHFEPADDITSIELAQILILISAQTGSTAVHDWLRLPDGIPAPLDRHFRAQTYPGVGG